MRWKEGVGPGVVEELLGGGGGRAGPACFGGRPFLVDIWGVAAKEWDSLVQVYTSSSNFLEKLRSWEAGERNNMSDERDCFSGVTRDCDVLLWFSWLIPESYLWELNLGAVLICLSVVCSVGRAQLILCP